MKEIKVRVDETTHGMIAACARALGVSMESVVVSAIGPHLSAMARLHNRGRAWKPAKPRMGRPPKGGRDAA